MLGKPKYDYGDVVTFKCGNELKTGIVAIIDANGTFFDQSDVSYDILNKEENMLYKHFREDLIVEKLYKVNENDIWQ